ncbi:MAG: hypothetical protein GYB31_15480 [Bacteroidetes bacterium]|nr:hypothetical protein [Bacteroidota bacterium]
MLDNIETASNALNKATEQVHAAAQFLGMAGKYFVPAKDDDSHTNMAWRSDLACFSTQNLGTEQNLHLLLYPESFVLHLVNGDFESLAQLSLNGRSMDEVAGELRGLFSQHGLDGNAFKLDFHYDLPDYPVLNGGKLQRLSDESHEAFSVIRSLADQILYKYSGLFEHASETRTWPHHFDHAIYCPLTFGEDGEVQKSLGMGLAIHDGSIPEQYFYIRPWEKDKARLAVPDKDLPDNAYWFPGDFPMAVLKISSLIDIDKDLARKEQLHNYLQEGIQQSLKMLQLPGLYSNAD